MNRPPSIPADLATQLGSDQTRAQAMIDVFGFYLMWARRRTVEDIRATVGSAKRREKLGTIFREVYDRAAKLNAEQQQICADLAQRGIDNFAQEVLTLFGNDGNDLVVDTDHAVRFRLVVELIDVPTDQPVAVQEGHKGEKFLGAFWGRWLNQF